MAKISIEAAPVLFNSNANISTGSGTSLAGHLLIIFEDDYGKEFVVRGGSRLDRDN